MNLGFELWYGGVENFFNRRRDLFFFRNHRCLFKGLFEGFNGNYGRLNQQELGIIVILEKNRAKNIRVESALVQHFPVIGFFYSDLIGSVLF